MATSFTSLAPFCLVALALAGCAVAPATGVTAAATASPAMASASPSAVATVRPAGGAAVLTPCQADFNQRDKDGDGLISKQEWLASEAGKTFIQAPEAAFDQKDANKDGQLTPAEFGCE